MRTAAGLAIIVAAVTCLIVVYWVVSRGLGPATGSLEYKDLVSILLTAASVVLAGVGIAVALLALWGYNALAALARETSEKTAKDEITAYLETPAFQQKLTELAQQAALDISGLREGVQMDGAPAKGEKDENAAGFSARPE